MKMLWRAIEPYGDSRMFIHARSQSWSNGREFTAVRRDFLWMEGDMPMVATFWVTHSYGSTGNTTASLGITIHRKSLWRFR
jgi:hypothetical protein